MFTTITDEVTIAFSAITLTGRVDFNPANHTLVLRGRDTDPRGEVMTTNLNAYGLEPREDTAFIKDWSEHTGVAASLEAAGVVEIVRALNVGPFSSRAYEVRVLHTAAAPKRELVGA
jgi:hypothetical protein